MINITVLGEEFSFKCWSESGADAGTGEEIREQSCVGRLPLDAAGVGLEAVGRRASERPDGLRPDLLHQLPLQIILRSRSNLNLDHIPSTEVNVLGGDVNFVINLRAVEFRTANVYVVGLPVNDDP